MHCAKFPSFPEILHPSLPQKNIHAKDHRLCFARNVGMQACSRPDLEEVSRGKKRAVGDSPFPKEVLKPVIPVEEVRQGKKRAVRNSSFPQPVIPVEQQSLVANPLSSDASSSVANTVHKYCSFVDTQNSNFIHYRNLTSECDTTGLCGTWIWSDNPMLSFKTYLTLRSCKCVTRSQNQLLKEEPNSSLTVLRNIR